MSPITLRPAGPADLDAIFEQMRDPVSVRMAAFTAEDPTDRTASDAHMTRVLSSPQNVFRCIVEVRDPLVVGTIASFVDEGAREVTYWVDRAYWGRGIATRALRLLLVQTPERPVRARAASDNVGSLRVLHKVGFHPIGTQVSYAAGRAHEIEETILELA